MKKGDYVIINKLKKNINFNEKIAIIINNKTDENYISIKTYNYFKTPEKFINIYINKKNLRKYNSDAITNFNWNSHAEKTKFYKL